MNMHNQIEYIENKWLNILFNYCKQLFSQTKLLSHDQYHHLRVWNYSKLILYSLAQSPERKMANCVEKIIFAAFFHDMGMITNSGENHGFDSCQMLKQFMSENKINFTYPFDDVFEAITNHDNKNYSKGFNQLIDKNIILFVLSIADDLDALGAIGVLRYYEIYSLRNIQYYNIPFQILTNVKKRYNNIKAVLKNHHIQNNSNTSSRYEYIYNFYNTILLSCQWQKNCYYGNAGVINIYEDLCMTGSSGYKNFIIELRKNADPLQLKFAEHLEHELTQNNPG